MTRQHGAGNKPAENAGGWKRSLADVLEAHNGARQDGAVASAATRDKRSDVLFAGFARLRALGFKLGVRLDTATSLRDKHIVKLMEDWRSRGLSASTLQNNLSIFRTFAEWIGKAGMVRGVAHYLGPGVAVRSSIARQDRSWSAKGIDLAAKIEQVRLKDPRVALQLELQAAFGLRAREAMQLRPALDRAKAVCATRSSSTSDPQLKLHQWKNHYYQVVRACGITRKDGITSHGLRHEYANNRYQELTGSDSPVRGGAPVNEQMDQAARHVVAEELGHSSRRGIPGPIPVCATTWWSWVKTGKAPRPLKLSPGMTVWRAEEIHAFIARLSVEAPVTTVGRGQSLVAARRRKRAISWPVARNSLEGVR